MAKQIHQLASSASIGTSDYLAKDSGTATTKVTTSQIANFALRTYTLLLAGATQTVQAAINGLKTTLDNLKTLVGSTSITGTGKSTVCELLGNTSIADLGDGTVTGGMNALNSAIATHGNTEVGYLASTTSVPDGTATALTGCSVTLSAGSWLIIGKVTYQGGTAGTYRQARLGTTATGNEYGLIQFDGATNNRSAMIDAITNLTATRTFYLSAQHGNGSATNVAGGRWNTFIEAIRIG